MAALSDSDILEQYKLARDTLVVAIQNGTTVVEYQVMSRRKRVADPVAELRIVEQMITHYERRVSNAAGGRARNYISFGR